MRFSEIPLMHQPRDGWTYNASYDVLGVLVARAVDQDCFGGGADTSLLDSWTVGGRYGRSAAPARLRTSIPPVMSSPSC